MDGMFRTEDSLETRIMLEKPNDTGPAYRILSKECSLKLDRRKPELKIGLAHARIKAGVAGVHSSDKGELTSISTDTWTSFECGHDADTSSNGRMGQNWHFSSIASPFILQPSTLNDRKAAWQTKYYSQNIQQDYPHR